MIASFDSLSRIVYIQVKVRTPVVRTIEFDPTTILEIDSRNDLIAIEMIKPSSLILKRIAKKYERWELARIDLNSLQKSID